MHRRGGIGDELEEAARRCHGAGDGAGIVLGPLAHIDEDCIPAVHES